MPALDKSHKIAYGLIVLLCFLCFGNTLKNGYALDDEIVTGPTNVTAKGLSSVKEIFSDWYQNELGNKFEYRPLVKFSFAVENQFFGLSPAPHHFFNIIYYSLCCFLLFRFLYRLNDGKIIFPFIATALFIAHPSHTEVVASLKNRDVMLVFIFGFLAGNRLLKMFEEKNFGVMKLIGIILLFYLAMLSKRDALLFLFVFPPVLFLKYRPKISSVALIALIIPVCYILMSLTAKTLIAEAASRHRGLEYFENPLIREKSLANHLTAFFNSGGFYFMQNFFPVRQVCYYGYNALDILSAKSFFFFTGIAGFVTAAILFFKNIKKDFFLSAGIIFLVGGMSLYVNLRPVPGIVADRFTFVSSVGAVILFCVIISKIADPRFFSASEIKKIPATASGMFAVLLLLSLYFTVRRNADWKDKQTLFSTDVTKAPRSAKLHSLYALELTHQFRNNKELSPLQKDQLAQTAISELRKSLDIFPGYTNSQSNLAYLLLATNGSAEEAKQLLEKANAEKEDNAEILYNYADALRKTGDTKKSEEELLKCIQLKPDLQPAYNLLVEVAWKNKTLPNAITVHKEALRKGFRNQEMFMNLGNCFARESDTLNAVTYYDSSLTINPANKNLGKFLYGYYSRKGMKEKADRIAALFKQK